MSVRQILKHLQTLITFNKKNVCSEIESIIKNDYVPPEPPVMLFQMREIEIPSTEIENLIKEIEPSFSERIMEIIREKGLNEVKVYKKAELDRRLFSKLRSNTFYRPTKNTAIFLCMSMELSYEETVDLLSCAGFAFSNSNKVDLIAQYFFRQKIYDVYLYKEILYKYDALD